RFGDASRIDAVDAVDIFSFCDMRMAVESVFCAIFQGAFCKYLPCFLNVIKMAVRVECMGLIIILFNGISGVPILIPFYTVEMTHLRIIIMEFAVSEMDIQLPGVPAVGII